MSMKLLQPRSTAAVLCALGVAVLAGACAPLLMGGAMVGGSLVAVDRRTAGTQLEDETIEFKAAARSRELSPAGHVNQTSYNRMLLITGEVPSEVDRNLLAQQLARVESVRSVVNELAVMGNTSLTARSNDTIISAKVKASFVDAKDLQATAVKVVTERGTVFLMGRVTEREATRAADLARGVNGVQKVVRVFEMVSEAELAKLLPAPSK